MVSRGLIVVLLNVRFYYLMHMTLCIRKNKRVLTDARVDTHQIFLLNIPLSVSFDR